MAIPEVWIKAAIEASADCLAYPVDAPEGVAPPYVTFARVGTTRELTLEENVENVVGSFEVVIYADSYLEAKEIADSVRQSIHNFSGDASGVTIELSALTDEVDGSPVYLDGRDRPTYSVEHSYSVHWIEDISSGS
jgi:hypothetical protein